MKKFLIAIAITLIIAIGVMVYYVWLEKDENRTESFFIPNVLEPFIRMEKNEEMTLNEISLNGQNREMYYYFDIYNYDEISEEYNSLAITPYVKIDIKQNNINESSENNISNYVTVNLYYINDISMGLVEGNLEEMIYKGENGSGFEEYFECKRLPKYNKQNEQENVSHYVAKLTLNSDDENYNNLTQNIMQKLEIILGYRK